MKILFICDKVEVLERIDVLNALPTPAWQWHYVKWIKHILYLIAKLPNEITIKLGKTREVLISAFESWYTSLPSLLAKFKTLVYPQGLLCSDWVITLKSWDIRCREKGRCLSLCSMGSLMKCFNSVTCETDVSKNVFISLN